MSPFDCVISSHACHHLFALYALGALPSLLDAAYHTHTSYQRPAMDSPEDITLNNWKDHLGDEKYYRAYLKFFAYIVLQKGFSETLETFIFANNLEQNNEQKEQPRMVNRLLSGLLHPLIHIGYALEFESPGMLAEGLSLACVTDASLNAVIPENQFAPRSAGAVAWLTTILSVLPTSNTIGIHAFSILERMLKDPDLAPGAAYDVPSDPDDFMTAFAQTLDRRGDLILKYVYQWSVDTADPADVKAKVEDLSWLVTLIYGVGGLQPGRGKDFKANFFTMHLVTSSLFLPSYLNHLSQKSQRILLASYLAAALVVWIAIGRPTIHVAHFYATAPLTISPPGMVSTPGPDVLDGQHPTPNPWHALLSSSLMHPNEHLPKLQRALTHYATIYGAAPAGRFDGTELSNAEMLDGTLFVRVAGLSMNRLGWVREGQDKKNFDHSGFWD